MGVNIFFKQDSEVITVIEFEWNITGAGIFGIIVSKFNY